MRRDTIIHVRIGEAIYVASAEAVIAECRQHYGDALMSSLERYGVRDEATAASLSPLARLGPEPGDDQPVNVPARRIA